MENTTVTTGKTIDELDPIPGTTSEEKAAFIADAVLPIRGNGTTYKVTGADLQKAGENKIDSISVNGTAVTPDANKNVNLTIDVPHADEDTIYQDSDGVLSVANPLPEGDPQSYNQILYAYSDNTPEWFSVGKGLLIPCKPGTLDPDGTITTYIGTGLSYGGSGEIDIINPVPDPNDENHPAQAGDVLTYNGDDIVWAAPQGGGGIPDPSSVTNGYVLTVSNGAATWAAPGGGGSSNVEQISMICLKNQSTADKTVIQSVSMTPKQALQSYNSGKTLILNVIVKTDLSSDEIWEQYTYPLSYLGYGWDGDDRYYILYFDYISALEGTGSDLWNGVKGKLDTTDGTWEISSPSDN